MEPVANMAQAWLDQNKVAIASVAERPEIQTLASCFARRMLEEISSLFQKNVRMMINTDEKQSYVHWIRAHRAASLAQQKIWPDFCLQNAWEETTKQHGTFSWLPEEDVSEAGCWTRSGSTKCQWLPETEPTWGKVQFVWEVFMYMAIARAHDAVGAMLEQVAAKADGVPNKPYCQVGTYRGNDAKAGPPLGLHVTIGWHKG